jgi:hypothetical protein
MNYLGRIKTFYRQLNLEWATEDEFFQEYKARLISELKKTRMKFEADFWSDRRPLYRPVRVGTPHMDRVSHIFTLSLGLGVPLLLLATFSGQIESLPQSVGRLMRLPQHPEGTQDPATIAKRERHGYLCPLLERLHQEEISPIPRDCPWLCRRG